MKTKERTNRSIEEINHHLEELADLPATDEQSQQAKGGPMNYAKIEFEYKPQKSDGTLS